MSTPSETSRPIWVSPREACRISSLGMTRIYELLNDGTLVSRKLGNRRLVLHESLERLGIEDEGEPGAATKPPAPTRPAFAENPKPAA